MFSYFALPNSFSAITRASGPVFQPLRPHTHFRRYRGRSFPFSCFARSDSFSAVPRASYPVFMFLSPGLVLGATVGVGTHFHVFCSRTRFRRNRGVESRFLVFRSWTRFRRYCGRQIPFSCFALPDSFSAVKWASCRILMFCAPGLVFGGTRGVGSRFLVLRVWTRFWRFRGRRVPFSCFAPPYSFSAIARALGPVFMFCALGLVFGGIVGVGSRFHVFCSRTRFRRYRGRRVAFSCFALPNSLSAIPTA
jgi:hypothetical protein